MELAGSTVLVTGASSGIGAALAVRLARAGATVGLVARREELLADVVAQCRGHAPESRHWSVDLADTDAAERVALEAWDSFGHLDALVNNAGIPKRKHVTRLSYAEVEDVARINYLSPVRMTLALLPRMLARGAGTIVNVGSVAGRLGTPRESAYSGSKFALSGFTEALYVDLYSTPLEVRLVSPGPIDTPIWDLPDNEDASYAGPKFPADDVAAAIEAALRGEGTFETYVPADFRAVAEYKAANIDTFLQGTASFDASGGEIPADLADDAHIPGSMA
jgi:short-subunit dehydrogenase